MRLSLKFFAVLWLILFLALGGLLYNAYTKLKPDTFVAILNQEVQRNYPGSTLVVGDLDYHLSIDFNMSLKNLVLKRNDEVLGSLKEIELRVPWWLLMFKRGKAQINLTDLEMVIDARNSNAGSPVSTKVSGPSENPASDIRIRLPDYLSSAQFTLRAKNVAIRDQRSSRRYIRIAKLLVRDFQYGKNSAFEVKLPINISHKEHDFTSELWLFGDVTPSPEHWKLNFRGEFRTRDSDDKARFEDIIMEGRTSFNPKKVNLSSNLTMFIDKEQMGSGSFILNEEQYTLDLRFTKLPLAFVTIFQTELKTPYLMELKGDASGPMKVSKRFDEPELKLTGELNFPGDFYFSPKEKIAGKWLIEIDGPRWVSSFISPKSEVSFFRRAFMDEETNSIKQYDEQIGFTGLVLSSGIQAVMPLGSIVNPSEKKFFRTDITFTKCLWNEKTVDGEFHYGHIPDTDFYQGKLAIGESTVTLDYQKFKEASKLSLTLEQFPWNEHFLFLEPYFAAKAGTLHGKVDGQWKGMWESGQFTSTLSASKLSGGDGSLYEFQNSFWQVFNLDPQSEQDFSWNLNLKNALLKIDSFGLLGPDPAKITGSIDVNQKQKSYLLLSYPKNRKWKPIRKDLATLIWKKEEV